MFFNETMSFIEVDLIKKMIGMTFSFFIVCLSQTQEDARDLDALTLAKSYFDLKEYDRAAYFLKGCCSQKAYFLYMYSRYLVRLFRFLACPQPLTLDLIS